MSYAYIANNTNEDDDDDRISGSVCILAVKNLSVQTMKDSVCCTETEKGPCSAWKGGGACVCACNLSFSLDG